MLPPIEDSVLQSNPKFAALHATLTKSILNPTGSTKLHPAQKERDAVTEELKTTRIRIGKRHLIRTAITNLDTSSASTSGSSSKSQTKPTTLPPDLLEFILLFSSHLTSAPLTPSSHKPLTPTPQWNSFPTHLSQLSSLISSHLQTQALALARVFSPTTNASYLHRTIPKLLGNITELRNDINAKKMELSKRRTALVSKTSMVLANYHVATTLTIHLLEQSKHGALSRHLKTKTEYLGLHAQEVNLEVKEKKIKGERMVYTQEVKDAIGNYVENLRDGKERLRERRGQAERTLWGYGVGRENDEKERVMREIARVYGELTRELREVGRDVERLKGR